MLAAGAAVVAVEVVGAVDVAADALEAEGAVDAAGAEELGLDPLEVDAEELLEVDPVPFGGSTETPLEAGALDVVVLGADVVDVDVLAALPDVLAPVVVAEVDGVVVDVDGDVADGVALCVCAGGVLVRVPCPTGKKEPPVINVAMMPAITATRAMPISRSGQLRRNQSMIPF